MACREKSRKENPHLACSTELALLAVAAWGCHGFFDPACVRLPLPRHLALAQPCSRSTAGGRPGAAPSLRRSRTAAHRRWPPPGKVRWSAPAPATPRRRGRAPPVAATAPDPPNLPLAGLIKEDTVGLICTVYPPAKTKLKGLGPAMLGHQRRPTKEHQSVPFRWKILFHFHCYIVRLQQSRLSIKSSVRAGSASTGYTWATTSSVVRRLQCIVDLLTCSSDVGMVHNGKGSPPQTGYAASDLGATTSLNPPFVRLPARLHYSISVHIHLCRSGYKT